MEPYARDRGKHRCATDRPTKVPGERRETVKAQKRGKTEAIYRVGRKMMEKKKKDSTLSSKRTKGNVPGGAKQSK